MRTATRDKKYKRYGIEVTELKNTVSEVKSILQGFNNRLYKTEEGISYFKDRAQEFTQAE